jgi:hypothetical protein
MGRSSKKLRSAKVRLPVRTLGRIAAIAGKDRIDEFIRAAIERELTGSDRTKRTNGEGDPGLEATKVETAAARIGDSSAPPFRLASVKEACRYGRFSHTKCYDYINDGNIIAYKRNRQTLIDLDSIDRWHASLERVRPKHLVSE